MIRKKSRGNKKEIFVHPSLFGVIDDWTPFTLVWGWLWYCTSLCIHSTVDYPISFLKFKFSNEKTAFVPCDNLIFSQYSTPVLELDMKCVITSVTHFSCMLRYFARLCETKDSKMNLELIINKSFVCRQQMLKLRILYVNWLKYPY